MKVLYEEVKQMSPEEQTHAINNFKKETDGKFLYRADGGCISSFEWGWSIKAGKNE